MYFSDYLFLFAVFTTKQHSVSTYLKWPQYRPQWVIKDLQYEKIVSPKFLNCIGFKRVLYIKIFKRAFYFFEVSKYDLKKDQTLKVNSQNCNLDQNIMHILLQTHLWKSGPIMVLRQNPFRNSHSVHSIYTFGCLETC